MEKMEAEDLSYIRSMSLFHLSSATERLLSNLLNSTKVLLTDGTIRRHRDWRGLASLVNISSEVEATIWNYQDKTQRVVELWASNQTATVGELLNHLITLDRYDVYEDIIESIREELRSRPANQVALPNNNNNCSINNDTRANNDLENEILTYEDRLGHEHKYHAFVLSAKEDEAFVMEMKRVLTAQGFEICTKDNLLPGFSSQYPPVAKLIRERCKRIIIVFSPEFLLSHDNSFFRDFAQADSIVFNVRKLVPIMYRQCTLPPHMSIYCMLYFNSGVIPFWDKLIRTMETSRYTSLPNGAVSTPQVNIPINLQVHNNLHAQSNSQSAVNITTMRSSDSDDKYFLTPNSLPNGSTTPGAVSLAPSTVSLAQSTASLPERLNGTLKLDSTNNLIKPKKKKKRNFILRSLNFFKVKEKNPVCA